MVGSKETVSMLAVVLLVTLAGCGLPVIDGGQPGTGTPATSSSTPSDGPGSAGGTPNQQDGSTPSTPNQVPSRTASPTVEPTPTVESPTGVRVIEVNADVGSVDEEYVVLKNGGDAPLDLSGWRIKDGDGDVYTFPDGVSLGIDQTLTLHSGRGSQTESDRYWWSDEEIWDDDGETIAIFDDRGHKVYERRYS